jgi:hypothetical protein
MKLVEEIRQRLDLSSEVGTAFNLKPQMRESIPSSCHGMESLVTAGQIQDAGKRFVVIFEKSQI